MRNNLFLGGRASVAWFYTTGSFENNTVIGPNSTTPFQAMKFIQKAGQVLSIRNNAIYDLQVPIIFGNECGTPCPMTGPIAFAYNVLWPAADSFYQIYDPGRVWLGDTANTSRYPMFVDDSLYRLQFGSPLIDAGDPSILDADGSRSDVGWTGGPGGIAYEYIDLPPLPPESLGTTGRDTIIALQWLARSEGDLQGYRLYRGYAPGFWMPGLPPIYEFDATIVNALDRVSHEVDTLYYVVTSIDLAGQESDPSLAVQYIISAHPLGDAPQWMPVGVLTVKALDSLELLVHASDPDDDPLTLTALLLDGVENLDFADLGGGTGEIQFHPTAAQIGNVSMPLEASDGFLTDTLELLLTVRLPNRSPVWSSVEPYTIAECDTLRLLVVATDADIDTLIISQISLPPNASLTSSGDGVGLLEFAPDTNQAGEYSLKLVVSDGRLSDTVDVTVRVINSTCESMAGHPGIVKVFPNPVVDGPVSAELIVPGGTTNAQDVQLVLHDLLGRTVARCFNGSLTAGRHILEVDLSNAELGVDLARGVYLLRMQVGERTLGELVKIAILK